MHIGRVFAAPAIAGMLTAAQAGEWARTRAADLPEAILATGAVGMLGRPRSRGAGGR
jgi:hypothetical protein